MHKSKILTTLAAGLLAAGIGSAAFAAGAHEDLKGEMGEHVMAGTITKIDHQKGTLSLKTDEATLALHFPPPAIRGFKVGDKAAVELAISKNVAAAEHASLGEDRH